MGGRRNRKQNSNNARKGKGDTRQKLGETQSSDEGELTLLVRP